MQCLYCGKGIGPIRQLRDLEFCSEAHRTQFRERYRQQVYEALAPEPAPEIADFMERPACGGPAPRTWLHVMPKSLAGEWPPAMRVDPVGVSVERPGWMFAQSLAAMPTRLARWDSAAAYPSSIRTASFSMAIKPPGRSAAGAAPTHLVAGNSTPVPSAAARISESSRLLPYSVTLHSVTLMDAGRIPALAKAEPSSPQPRAAIPVYSDPAAIGPMLPAAHAAVALQCSITIAGPTAPPAPASAPEVGFSPAVSASQPRPLEALPLPIEVGHAFSLPGLLPKVGLAFSLPRLLPKVSQAFSLPTPLPQLAKPPLALALAASPSSHASARLECPAACIGSVAGLLQPGSSPVREAAGNRNPRPAVAAWPIRPPSQLLPYSVKLYSVTLPEAGRIPALAKAEPSSPQPRAAIPVYSDPAAIGPMLPAVHAAVALQCTITIAGPTAPPGPASAPEVDFSPAVSASQPRPLEVLPLPIEVGHAFSLPGLLPKVELAFSLPRLLPEVSQAFSLPTPLPQPAKPPLALALAASPSSHASARLECPAACIGSVAGLLQPGSSPVREAAGNRNPHPAVAACPAPIRPPAAPRELSALPVGLLGEMLSAPPRPAEAPAPAAPPAAAPSWDAAIVAVPLDRHLVPLPDIALPRIDCLPAPAGAVDAGCLPLRPDAGRAVRSCAVLWTLRVAHMCHPPFRMDPVRARFNDLVRDRSMPYSRDLEDQGPAKTNLRPFREFATDSSKRKWQFIGAAAAALLLAGALGLQVAPKGFGESLPWHGTSIRQWMSQRATRNFADDFRGGLDQWKGMQAKRPKSWSYSTDGFIRPGQLALYRPSVTLTDYRFEFMAQVESKSVDWVVRAHDAGNYYALKFKVLQPGPRPMVAMVRYPVIDGNQGAPVQTPLRMMIHANTPYRVTVDVKGNRFRTYIEDQEADFWTEDGLKTGGVGFFSEAGERARVYWVKLESHGDLLGRICGLLSGKSSEGATDKEIQARWITGMQEPLI